MKFFTSIFTCLLFYSGLPAQDLNASCKDIHTGIFYYYPQNEAGLYLEVRDENMLTEKNLATGDTATWKIEWINPCTYSLKYISGNKTLSREAGKLVKNHKLVYKILTVNADYYTFNGYVDKTTNLPIQTDTIWLHEKLTIPDNTLFQQVTDPMQIAGNKITDTSRYALLYVYRPKKFTNSLGNFIVYFNDNLLCVGRNNTGYIFKVFKEGTFEIKSRLFDDIATTNINIVFGESYFVKTAINWEITSRLYNFKLKNIVVDAAIGKTEFSEVRLH